MAKWAKGEFWQIGIIILKLTIGKKTSNFNLMYGSLQFLSVGAAFLNGESKYMFEKTQLESNLQKCLEETGKIPL